MTIIDASVATAWFVSITTSKGAEGLRLQQGLAAPALLKVELTSSLLKYVRVDRLSGADLLTAIEQVGELIQQWEEDRNLLPLATDIALSSNHKIYDCLYLALAMKRRDRLATADRRMAVLATNLGIQTELIEPSL
jgi:predicted nucleic acid-binding protein